MNTKKQTETKTTGHPTVDAIARLEFSGNIYSDAWLAHLTYETKRETYCHYLAVLLLSHLIYWYKPSRVHDEETGKLKGWKKKFKSDKLQRSYGAIADIFHCTDKQARDAVKFLKEKGLITTELRNVPDKNGRVLPNVMYIDLIPHEIARITYSLPLKEDMTEMGDISQMGQMMSPKSDTYPTEMGGTYTESSTKNSNTENSYLSADAEATNEQWQSQEFGATQQAKVTESANAGASLNGEDNGEGSEKKPCRTSSESGAGIGYEETELTSKQKDSAAATTQTAPKRRRSKRSPEEIAAEKAEKEAKKLATQLENEEKKRLKQEQVDRDNQWRYDIFGSKERYLSFNAWWWGTWVSNQNLNNDGLFYKLMLENLSMGGEKHRAIVEEFKKYELKQQKLTEVEQKNTLAAQAANPQSTQPTTPGDRPQLPNPEDYLSPTNLAAFNKANFDEDLRAECIMKTYGKAEFSQANTIRGLAVQQSNRNKSKA